MYFRTASCTLGCAWLRLLTRRPITAPGCELWTWFFLLDTAYWCEAREAVKIACVWPRSRPGVVCRALEYLESSTEPCTFWLLGRTRHIMRLIALRLTACREELSHASQTRRWLIQEGESAGRGGSVMTVDEQPELHRRSEVLRVCGGSDSAVTLGKALTIPNFVWDELERMV